MYSEAVRKTTRTCYTTTSITDEGEEDCTTEIYAETEEEESEELTTTEDEDNTDTEIRESSDQTDPKIFLMDYVPPPSPKYIDGGMYPRRTSAILEDAVNANLRKYSSSGFDILKGSEAELMKSFNDANNNEPSQPSEDAIIDMNDLLSYATTARTNKQMKGLVTAGLKESKSVNKVKSKTEHDKGQVKFGEETKGDQKHHNSYSRRNTGYPGKKSPAPTIKEEEEDEGVTDLSGEGWETEDTMGRSSRSPKRGGSSPKRKKGSNKSSSKHDLRQTKSTGGKINHSSPKTVGRASKRDLTGKKSKKNVAGEKNHGDSDDRKKSVKEKSMSEKRSSKKESFRQSEHDFYDSFSADEDIYRKSRSKSELHEKEDGGQRESMFTPPPEEPRRSDNSGSAGRESDKCTCGPGGIAGPACVQAQLIDCYQTQCCVFPPCSPCCGGQCFCRRCCPSAGYCCGCHPKFPNFRPCSCQQCRVYHYCYNVLNRTQIKADDMFLGISLYERELKTQAAIERQNLQCFGKPLLKGPIVYDNIDPSDQFSISGRPASFDLSGETLDQENMSTKAKNWYNAPEGYSDNAGQGSMQGYGGMRRSSGSGSCEPPCKVDPWKSEYTVQYTDHSESMRRTNSKYPQFEGGCCGGGRGGC